MNKKEKKGVVPLGDYVLLKREDAIQTKSGIFIPQTAQEKPKQGIVVAVGPGRLNDEGKLESMTVKEKDKVLFSSYAGNEIQFEGQEYLVMRESDILGILEE